MRVEAAGLDDGLDDELDVAPGGRIKSKSRFLARAATQAGEAVLSSESQRQN